MIIKIKQKIYSNNFFLGICCFTIMIVPVILVNYIYLIIKELFNAFRNSKSIKLPLFFTFDFKSLWILYLITAGLSLITCLIFLYNMNKNYKKIHDNEKGSRRWTTIDEIKTQYKEIPDREEEYPGNGGFLISHIGDKAYIDDSPVNNLIIGITRSGKTQRNVIPQVDIYSRAEIQPSIIINDPKLEVARYTAEALSERGYDINIFNLIEPENGMGYNPFAIIVEEYKNGDYGKAQLLTRTFSFMLFHDEEAKDKAWQEWAIGLSNAVILAHIVDCVAAGTEKMINPTSVARMVIRMGSTKTQNGKSNALDDFMRIRPESDIARIQYASVEFAPSEKTKPTIFAMFMSKFEIFTYTSVVHLCSHNTLNLSDIGFGKKPVVLFMGVPDYDNSNHFLASLLVRQIYYVLAKRASKEISGKCKREVVFLLDEFGNMPAIPDMDTIITVCQGRNIKFNLIAQSYEQIESKYQEKPAKTIINNCGNQMYLLSNDENTAKRFSEHIGNETIIIYGRSDGAGKDKNISEHIDGKELLNPNELMELMEGENVLHRVIKRKDLQDHDIIPYPVFNSKNLGTSFIPAYKYLKSFNDSGNDSLEKHTKKEDIGDYEELVYRPDIKCNPDNIPLKELLQERELEIIEKLTSIPAKTVCRITKQKLLECLQDAYSEGTLTKEKIMSTVNYINSCLINAAGKGT